MDTETTLTFWTWVPDIKKEVDLFRRSTRRSRSTLVNVGQGAPHYQKLRTAIQSGQGAPDVAQMEFQYIPSFTLGDGNLLDLTPYAPADTAAQYPEWVWSQVSVNDGLLGRSPGHRPDGSALPRGPAPDAGVEPPKTWDDFAAAADTYRTKNPKSYLVNVAPSQAGQIMAYMWQTGARPFTFDGEKTVKSTWPATRGKQVAKYWGDLVTNGGAPRSTPTSPTRGTRDWPTASTPPGRPPPGDRSSCRAPPARPPGSGGPPTCRSGMPARRCPPTGAARPTRC